MQQFTHARADERDAEQVAVVEVDHHARPAPVAVGVQLRARHHLAEFDVDRLDAVLFSVVTAYYVSRAVLG